MYVNCDDVDVREMAQKMQIIGTSIVVFSLMEML